MHIPGGGHGNPSPWRIPWTEEPGGLQRLRGNESDMTQGPKHHHIPWAVSLLFIYQTRGLVIYF